MNATRKATPTTVRRLTQRTLACVARNGPLSTLELAAWPKVHAPEHLVENLRGRHLLRHIVNPATGHLLNAVTDAGRAAL